MNKMSSRLLAVTLVYAALIGLIPILAPRLMTGALAIPTITIIVTLTVLLLVTIVKDSQRNAAQEKRKRDEETLDPYEQIDRMVDALDADELTYLRERMEQHTGRSSAKAGLQPERESLGASVNGAHHRKADRA